MGVGRRRRWLWVRQYSLPVDTRVPPPPQVAGYVVDYGHGLSYATVKGAGHMVPETNPREALAMFQVGRQGGCMGVVLDGDEQVSGV